MSGAFTAYGLTVTPTNVLGLRRVILTEAAELRTALKDFMGRHSQGMPVLGGDPVSPYAAVGFTDCIDAYLAHIDGLVAMLGRHGIRSLIDMHQDDYSAAFYDPSGSTPWKAEGAPLWAVCTGAPNSSGAPLPASTQSDWGTANFSDSRILAAFDHFWANDVSADLQGEFIRLSCSFACQFNSFGYFLVVPVL